MHSLLSCSMVGVDIHLHAETDITEDGTTAMTDADMVGDMVTVADTTAIDMVMAATHTEADTTTITIGAQIIMETMIEDTAMVHGVEDMADTMMIGDTAMEEVMDMEDTAADTAMAEATACMIGIETNEDILDRNLPNHDYKIRFIKTSSKFL